MLEALYKCSVTNQLNCHEQVVQVNKYSVLFFHNFAIPGIFYCITFKPLHEKISPIPIPLKTKIDRFISPLFTKSIACTECSTNVPHLGNVLS